MKGRRVTHVSFVFLNLFSNLMARHPRLLKHEEGYDANSAMRLPPSSSPSRFDLFFFFKSEMRNDSLDTNDSQNIGAGVMCDGGGIE